MDEFTSLLGKVITIGGGGAAIAYLIFRFLGQKWIEAKFAERLEAYKKEQEKELEYYRSQVNILFSRVTKIHEKEIEVLPEIWQKLQFALGKMTRITDPVQLFPDFMKMNETDFNTFIENEKLNDTHKSEFQRVEKPERLNYYKKIHFWYALEDTKKGVNDYHNYLILNRIFLSADLKKEFQEIDKLFSSILIDRETGELTLSSNHPNYELIYETYLRLTEKSKPIIHRIESLVQKRLEFDQAIPNFKHK